MKTLKKLPVFKNDDAFVEMHQMMIKFVEMRVEFVKTLTGVSKN